MFLICTLASAILASSLRPMIFGPTRAARSARITITTMISIRVKPRLSFKFLNILHNLQIFLAKIFNGTWIIGCGGFLRIYPFTKSALIRMDPPFPRSIASDFVLFYQLIQLEDRQQYRDNDKADP